jgi:ribosomal protein S27E
MERERERACVRVMYTSNVWSPLQYSMFLKKQKCNFNDSLIADFPFIQTANLKDTTVVNCNVCSSVFLIASGGRTSITDHLQAKKCKNSLLAKSQL